MSRVNIPVCEIGVVTWGSITCRLQSCDAM